MMVNTRNIWYYIQLENNLKETPISEIINFYLVLSGRSEKLILTAGAQRD